MHAQITLEERYAINVMRKQRYSIRAIAAEIGRAPSTISRELRRNLRPPAATSRASRLLRRRPASRSRRNARFGPETWEPRRAHLGMDWRPSKSQAGSAHGILRSATRRSTFTSGRDKACGGDLWTHLQAGDQEKPQTLRRPDWRGRLAGKRHISERPTAGRGAGGEIGHWEIDTSWAPSTGATAW